MKKILFILLFPLAVLGQSKFNKFLSKPIGKDSPYTVADCFHYYGSALMTVGFSYGAYRLIPIYEYRREGKSIAIGSGIALAIGVGGKEFIHDKFMHKGVFSVYDIITDCQGVAGGALGFKAGIDMHELFKDKRASQVSKIKRLRHDKTFNW